MTVTVYLKVVVLLHILLHGAVRCTHINLQNRCIGDIDSCSVETLWSSYRSNHMTLEIINKVLSRCIYTNSILPIVLEDENRVHFATNQYTVYHDGNRFVFNQNPLCGKAIATCANPEVTNAAGNRQCVDHYWDYAYKDIVKDRFLPHAVPTYTKSSQGFGHYITEITHMPPILPPGRDECYIPSTDYFYKAKKLFLQLVEYCNAHPGDITLEYLNEWQRDVESEGDMGITGEEVKLLDPEYSATRYKRFADYYYVKDVTEKWYALCIDTMGNTFYDVLGLTYRETPLIYASLQDSPVVIDPYKSGLVAIQVKPYCNVTGNCQNPWHYDVIQEIETLREYAFFASPKPHYLFPFFMNLTSKIRQGQQNCTNNSKMKLLRVYGNSFKLMKQLKDINTDLSQNKQIQGRSIERDQPCTMFYLNGGSVSIQRLSLDNDRCIAEMLASNKYIMNTALLGLKNIPFYSSAPVVVSPIDTKEVIFDSVDVDSVYIDLSQINNNNIYITKNFIENAKGSNNQNQKSFNLQKFIKDNIKTLGLNNAWDTQVFFVLHKTGKRHKVILREGKNSWYIHDTNGNSIEYSNDPNDYFITSMYTLEGTQNSKTHLFTTSVIFKDTTKIKNMYLDHINHNTRIDCTQSPHIYLDNLYIFFELNKNFTDASYYNGTVTHDDIIQYRNAIQHTIIPRSLIHIKTRSYLNTFGLFNEHLLRQSNKGEYSQNEIIVDMFTGLTAVYICLILGAIFSFLTIVVIIPSIVWKDVLIPRVKKKNMVIHSLLTSLIADRELDNSIVSDIADKLTKKNR